MTLTIDLPPDVEHVLEQHAARSGQDVRAFVLQAVREKLSRAWTLAEVGAPLARAVEAVGLIDEEFDRFFEEVREEAWQEKQVQGR
jgi:hypothetical protein